MADDRSVIPAAVPANRSLSALERTALVRDALSHTVRRLRTSTRSRKAFDTGAFARRHDARLVAIFYRVSFVIIFLLPSVASLAYFGFLASPQYVAEARFTVQGGEPVRLDAFGIVTGLPSMTVVQDTQVVTNYIESASIVRKLQDQLDLQNLYGSTNYDWLSRFNTTKPFEKLVEYWKSKIDVSIQLPGGIVTFTVRAFTAADSRRIAEAVLEAAETLVNEINRRMLEDNLTASRAEFERAALRLGRARAALEAVRNTSGVLDPGQSALSLGTLITGLRGDLLVLQQEYDSQAKYVSADAPQMKAMSHRLKIMSEQIRLLEAKMTGHAETVAPESRLSGTMTKFSELEVERRIAEQQFISASSSVEFARATADRRLLYLKTFLRPSLPQEPRYPRRILNIFLVVTGTFTAWAALCGLVSLARNHMA